MGWSGGSDIFLILSRKIQSDLPDHKRKELYAALYEWATTEDRDWDSQYEVVGIDPVLDEVLRENGDLTEEY